MSALSYSASQRGLRLVMMNGGGGQGAKNSHNNHRPPFWRGQHNHPQAENPLHCHHAHYPQQHHTPSAVGYRGNSHRYHGNGNVYLEHPHHHRANNSVVSDASRQTDTSQYPMTDHPCSHGNHSSVEPGGVAGYNRDLTNYDYETETIFSHSTTHTDNVSQSIYPYEDRVPPGRPNSPATITEYSERDIQIHLSPQSVLSEEDINEGNTGQQQ